jgi:hypothetical protein
MQIDNFATPVRSRATALAIAVGVHIALFAYWRLTQGPTAPDRDNDDAPAIQWIRAFTRPPVVTALAPAPKKVQAAPVRKAPQAASAANPAPPAQQDPPAPAESIPVDTTFAEKSPPSLRERALRDVGAIDKALRKESPGHHADSPHSSPESRLAAGIDSAKRPRLWEAPIIVPIADQGQNGRRIYKIITGKGIYCIYVDANHTPNGVDMMQKGIHQKFGSCPRES